MLEEMTHQQFNEWCAKDLVEPIGTDLGVAHVVAKLGVLIAGIMGQKIEETDFLPWLKKATTIPPLSAKQSAALLTSHLKMLKGSQ